MPCESETMAVIYFCTVSISRVLNLASHNHNTPCWLPMESVWKKESRNCTTFRNFYLYHYQHYWKAGIKMLHKYLCKFQHYPDVKTSTDTTMQFSTAITDSYFILALFHFTPITYILTELSFLVTLPFHAAIISLVLFFQAVISTASRNKYYRIKYSK